MLSQRPIKDTGPEATPPMRCPCRPAGRRVEKSHPTPPPCCMVSAASRSELEDAGHVVRNRPHHEAIEQASAPPWAVRARARARRRDRAPCADGSAGRRRRTHKPAAPSHCRRTGRPVLPDRDPTNPLPAARRPPARARCAPHCRRRVHARPARTECRCGKKGSLGTHLPTTPVRRPSRLAPWRVQPARSSTRDDRRRLSARAAKRSARASRVSPGAMSR
jgi:hypothetical protein